MANALIIVNFPCNESLFFDQVLKVFSFFFKISVVFLSIVLKSAGGKLLLRL